MGKVCIVRHGETDWNKLTKLQGKEDIELNELGRKQAKITGEYLGQYQWNKVYSSPLKRATETASIISSYVNVDEIIIEDDFIERDYGLATGMTIEERTLKYPNKKYPDSEDWTVLRDRVFNKLSIIAKMNEDKNIIVVSHGAVINSIIYTITQGEHGTGITELHSCALNMLKYQFKELKLEYFNRMIGFGK